MVTVLKADSKLESRRTIDGGRAPSTGSGQEGSGSTGVCCGHWGEGKGAEEVSQEGRGVCLREETPLGTQNTVPEGEEGGGWKDSSWGAESEGQRWEVPGGEMSSLKDFQY